MYQFAMGRERDNIDKECPISPLRKSAITLGKYHQDEREMQIISEFFTKHII